MNAWSRAAVGAVGWAAFIVVHVAGLQADAWAHALLLFATLVLVPLALPLFRDETESAATARWFRLADLAQLPCAILLLVACWLPAGPLSGLAALPWGLFTVLLAAIGLRRMRAGGLRRDLDGLCRDAALMFAIIGGAWVVTDRFGYQPLRFDRTIVALTAVHFHYAGLLLPLFAGLIQRELFFFRLASRAAVGVVLGVPAVALGITFTQLGWGPSFEAAAGCGLALAGMAVGVLHVRLAVDVKRSALTRALLAIAGVALFLGMVFAALYAARAFTTPAPGLGVPQMRMLHGTLNALGFGLGGVLAWRRMADERRAVR